MTRIRALYAYSSAPTSIGQSIELAVQRLRDRKVGAMQIDTWKEVDVPGRFISDGVLDRINSADVLIADITRLNFNVTFEIGYALGKGKPVILTVNTAQTPQTKESTRLGMFDTLVHHRYQNSEDLANCLAQLEGVQPPQFPDVTVDHSAPVYVLNLSNRTEMAVRMVARIKKTRIRFRSFDPMEQPRLSAQEAYRGVGSSIAVVVLLVSRDITEFHDNNMRGAFIAGLAKGMDKVLLILQDGAEPVPLDYRDLVAVCQRPDDVDRHINELAPQVIEGLQRRASVKLVVSTSFLGTLDLGASAAENEMTQLSSYYLLTDNFRRVLEGNVRLVVGRKGSGKTAMFVQIRSKIRADKKRIVLDLRPEGYQLKKFRDLLLTFTEATQEHLCVAFWEYVLLLEICHKVLDKDKESHIYNQDLSEPYQRLHALYNSDEFVQEGDFSERMLRLVQRIMSAAEEANSDVLTTREVIEIIYRHDIGTLREELIRYLHLKKDVWILFDNIDKGWPTKGVQPADILVLRGLLDATRDIERLLRRKRIATFTVVFVRNDVYELLVEETPDRGKESKVSLEWTDPDLLKELLRRRLIANPGVDRSITFEGMWTSIATSHIDGEKSDDYLIEMSLMRPRYLINLVNYCRANAVNLSHPKISEADIRKAVREYSADVGNEIGLEVRDVFPRANDILYGFLGAPTHLPLSGVHDRFREAQVPEKDFAALLEVLLWFAFFGVVVPGKEIQYSYTVFYDMKKLRKIAGDLSNPDTVFAIHRAFQPFLEIQ